MADQVPPREGNIWVWADSFREEALQCVWASRLVGLNRPAMLLKVNKHIWHFQPEAVHRRFCCAYSSAGFSAGEQCFSLFICAPFRFLTILMVFFVNYFYLLFEETKKNETLANNLSLWLSTACDCGLSPFSRHARPVGETSRGKTGWRKDMKQ